MRPSGSSLAIVNPGAPDAPPAVIHADDAAIVATIWTWHTRGLEIEAHECGRLRHIVDGIAAVFGCPGDIDSLPAKVRAMDELHAPGGEVDRLRGDVERLRSRLAASEAIAAKLPPPSEHAAELAPFAVLSLADIGHAAWLCGYHPGDDPRSVFVRVAKQRLEWMEIEALLRDELKKAREVEPACTVESLVESIRADAHAFADQIGKMHAEIERLRADVTPASRLAETAAERDEFWTTLRAIGLRDSESLEEFEARIAAEFAEAKQWRDNRADLVEKLREAWGLR